MASSILKTIAKPINRRLLLGTCDPCEIPNAHKVIVKQMDFDEWLKMYFTKWVSFYAHDPSGSCKQGDVVLMEELGERMTRDITHRVLRVVYPLGDTTDPISGKKCVRTRTREDIARINALWGANPKDTFDYDTAPPRGWQEGRKDWSHKKGFRKFHEFTDRDQTEASHMS